MVVCKTIVIGPSVTEKDCTKQRFERAKQGSLLGTLELVESVSAVVLSLHFDMFSTAAKEEGQFGGGSPDLTGIRAFPMN